MDNIVCAALGGYEIDNSIQFGFALKRRKHSSYALDPHRDLTTTTPARD